jgi:hypothetical protein
MRPRAPPADNRLVFLRRILRLSALAAIAAAVTATYALAASHELTATEATAAVPASSGLAVRHVSYEVDRHDPSRVAAVRLRLAAPSRGAVLTTLDGGATWLACTATGADLRCPTYGTLLRVQDAAGLALEPAA